MAAMMKSSVQMRVAAPARASRSTVVVRAQAESTDRRAVLGLFAAGAAALFAAPQGAQALGLPWQESTGGQLKGKGSLPKSSTAASMEGYTLEGFPGTKKPSYLEPKKKNKLRAQARAKAEAVAQK